MKVRYTDCYGQASMSMDVHPHDIDYVARIDADQFGKRGWFYLNRRQLHSLAKFLATAVKDVPIRRPRK